MESLIIEAEQDTPSILFDKGTNTFMIANRSYPEDAIEFYRPVLTWLREYMKNPNEHTIFDFKLDYFNTTSSKQIFKMMLLLEQLGKTNNVVIQWHYKKHDKELQNHGEIFSKIINVPFELIDF